MDQKAIISVLFAAVIALVGWNIKTTNELQLAVQRLEIILLQDAMLK
jgi:5S rRNA maturation endonuclease (ribonuclease M5)